jgi:hypothetical protein
MSTPEVELKKGTGPDQLPQGAAQELNANMPTPTELEPKGLEAPVQEDATQQFPDEATPADFEPLFEPATDDEMFITGPTTKPDESQLVGTEPVRQLPPVVRRQLPLLQRAAAEPGASADLQVLVRWLLGRS